MPQIIMACSINDTDFTGREMPQNPARGQRALCRTAFLSAGQTLTGASFERG